jgi:hypothetical protein
VKARTRNFPLELAGLADTREKRAIKFRLRKDEPPVRSHENVPTIRWIAQFLGSGGSIIVLRSPISRLPSQRTTPRKLRRTRLQLGWKVGIMRSRSATFTHRLFIVENEGPGLGDYGSRDGIGNR